ncbi:MAG: arylformamidase [Halanaerobiales bacterium]|nr:arylformamidase [Halanaerobiales bacterium]
MEIYDISMAIHPEMPVYKNREKLKPVFTVINNFQTGKVHQTRVTMDLHSGTHVDAPFHMLEEGKTSEHFNLEQIITECRVLDLTYVEDKITVQDLKEKQIKPGEFILFKTQNSYRKDFNINFIYLGQEGAKYLAKTGIVGVGIDSLGIERNQKGHPTHKTLLSNEITILEGLRLKGIKEGVYNLILAPLKIKGSDAAPVRALLVKGL